jgi:hypothetical protein
MRSGNPNLHAQDKCCHGVKKARWEHRAHNLIYATRITLPRLNDGFACDLVDFEYMTTSIVSSFHGDSIRPLKRRKRRSQKHKTVNFSLTLLEVISGSSSFSSFRWVPPFCSKLEHLQFSVRFDFCLVNFLQFFAPHRCCWGEGGGAAA